MAVCAISEICNEDIALYSFDVFDTVLTRIWSDPKDQFYELEEQLLDVNKKWKSFAKERIVAEYQLREERNFAKEVSLTEIYDLLRERLRIDTRDARMAYSNEIRIEKESIVPVPSVISCINSLRDKKKKICFISDTYHDKNFIKKVLHENGALQDGDSLYVSSEKGMMKATGELFQYVLQRQKINGDQLCHLGDNIEADYKIPKRLGIRAILFEDSKLTRYEEDVRANEELDWKRKSLLAGCYKLARLECTYQDHIRKTIWSVGVNVAGPLLGAYAHWCLTTAAELGLNRLYFVSRDGQILLKLARIINDKLKYDIELRYLYGSRQAWHLPAIRDIGEEELKWILAPTSVLNLSIILNRLNIKPAAVNELLNEYGFDDRWYTRPLKRQHITTVRKFLTDPRAKRVILSKVHSLRPAIIGYFKQEGLMRDDKYALVDIGWNGSLQRSLSRILGDAGYSFGIKGFYFGLRQRLKNKDSDVLLSYFSGHENPCQLNRLCYTVPVLEAFSAADHGGVVFYEQNGNSFEPKLRSRTDERRVEWGVLVQHAAMTRCIELVRDSKYDLIKKLRQLKDIHFCNFSRFMIDPTAEEARVIGSYPDSEEQNEAYFLPLAQKYTFCELIKNKYWGYRHHHNEWISASIKLSNVLYKKLLNMKDGCNLQ
jgi:predicted HAD superfamily hydrolase